VDGERVGASGWGIEGGYADADDTAVMGLLRNAPDATYLCSGTLIGENVVLTARHCVSDSPAIIACPGTEFGPTGAPTEMFATTAQTMPTYPDDAYHAVSAVIVPDGEPAICGRDVALLVLSTPVDPAEAVPMHPALDAAVEPGKVYSAVGYGNTAPETNTSGSRYRRDDLVVDCVGPDCIPGFTWESEWVGNTGVCSGDSGGPALDAEQRAFGLVSRGGMNCDAPMYIDLFGWAEWIRSNTRESMAAAGLTPPAWTEPPAGTEPPAEGDEQDEGGCSLAARTRTRGPRSAWWWLLPLPVLVRAVRTRRRRSAAAPTRTV
jgi:hypothetical protein